MAEEGIEYHTKIKHPYIFFRAPYFNNDIDYSTKHTEISSLYGILPTNTYAFIRVDPDKTYVYASELRDTYKAMEIFSYIDAGTKSYDELDSFVRQSKITLTEYAPTFKNCEILVDTFIKPDWLVHCSYKL